MSMKYMYKRNVTNDIIHFIDCNKKEFYDLAKEDFYELLWASDDVTGYASGSYFCSAWNAEDAVAHNWDLAYEALQEYGFQVNPFGLGAELVDVYIRCYLLSECFEYAYKFVRTRDSKEL